MNFKLKTMKKIVLILALVLVGNSIEIYAQYTVAMAGGTREAINRVYQVDEFIKRFDKGIDYKDDNSYNGTPYNNPSYLPGNIYENNTLLASDVALRYNAIEDEVEVKESLTTPDEDAKVLAKSLEIFVKINGDIFIFAPYQGGVENGGYFQILFEGDNYSLYKKLKKKFIPAKKASTSITKDLPPVFLDRPVYYIVTKKGKYYELPDSNGKKLKVFGNKQNEIKKYVKENRLDLKNEKDLIRVMIYFDNFKNSKE